MHSKLAPSAAHRWMNCSGCLKLIDDHQIFDSSNVHAKKGTAAHLVIEDCILRDLSPDQLAGNYIYVDDNARWLTPEEGEARKDEEDVFEVDSDMVSGVQQMIDVVDALKEEAPDGSPSMAEHYFDMTFLHPDLGGTADFTIYYPFGPLHIVDYKNGRTLVEVRANEQLLNYAVGGLHMFPSAESVVVHIVQPNASHQDGSHRWVEYPAAKIEEFSEHLLEAAEATAVPNAPLRTGPWCQYCPASEICPELKSDIAETAEADFAEDPPEALGMPKTGGDNVELGQMRLWIPVIDNWLRNLEGAVQRELEAGRKVPGAKLVQKRASSRKFLGTEEETIAAVMKLVRKVKAKKADIFTTPSLKSVKQIESIPGLKKLEGWSDLWEMPAGSGYTVADESDSRDGVTPAEVAAKDFEDD